MRSLSLSLSLAGAIDCSPQGGLCNINASGQYQQAGQHDMAHLDCIQVLLAGLHVVELRLMDEMDAD